jgi:hypothetical protein
MTVRHATLLVMLWTLTLSGLAQIVIEPSLTNLACTAIVVAASVPVLLYIRFSAAIDQQPLSTLMLFGFCVTTLCGALVAQSVTGSAVSASLRQPVETFAVLAAYELLAVLAHAAYRLFSNPRQPAGLARRWLGRIGVYTTPSVPALWIAGIIGCLSYCLPRPDGGATGAGGAAGGGLLSAVALAFNFLIAAPFLIPLYRKLESRGYGRSRWVYPGLALYAALAVLIGLIRNARAIMFVGLITVALAYLVTWLQSRVSVRSGVFMRLGIIVVLFLAVLGPVSDLATAMAIARAERGKASGLDMIATTLHVWQKPYLIQQYRDRERRAGMFDRYDEAYIANPLFARLIETKFHDNALYFAQFLSTGDSRDRLTRTTIELTWAILPTPVLKLLGIHIDKDDLNFSMGDYLAYLARGIPVGGRKTGSLFAQGQVVFGPLFPFVYVLLCLILFKWMDLLCCRRSDGSAFPVPLALLTSWHLVHLLCPESLHQGFNAIVRGIPTDIAVYTLVLGIAYLLTGGTATLRRRESPMPTPEAAVS